jgi:hypothetical protein
MSTPVTISVGPWVTGPSLAVSSAADAEKSRLSICWMTETLGTVAQQVKWWRAGQTENDAVLKNAVSVTVNFVDKNEVYFHRAVLEFPSSTTGISYKILADQLESPSAYTVTFPLKSSGNVNPSKIMVYGNCFDGARRGIVRDSFDSQFSNVEGSIILGNFTSEGTSTYSDYKDLINTDSILESNKPCLFVRDENETNQQDRLLLPYLSNSDYFDATFGQLRVIYLNTLNSRRQGILEKQRQWFYNEAIQNSEWKNNRYRMIIVNDPPKTTYYNQSCNFGDSGIDTFIQDNIMPMIRDSGTDLVLFCNGRSYQRGSLVSNYSESPHGIKYIVTGASSGSLHTKKCYSWAPPEEPGIIKDSNLYHYLIFNFKSSVLNIQVVDSSTATAEGPYPTIDEFNVYPHKLI